MDKLKIGDKGPKVKRLQFLLNTWMLPPFNYLIRPTMPRLLEDGLFGDKTQGRLRKFQHYRLIPQSGEVDVPTMFALHPLTLVKLDLEYKIPRLGEPLSIFKSASPLSGKPKDYDLDIDFTDSYGWEKPLLLSKDAKAEDNKWEYKRQIEAEIKIPSMDFLKPLEMSMSATYTPVGSGVEGKMKLSWEDMWKAGPVTFSPYTSLSAESDAFRNLAIKPALGAELKLDIFKLKDGTKGSLELDSSFGYRRYLIQDNDDRKPTWMVPWEGSALFKMQWGGDDDKKKKN